MALDEAILESVIAGQQPPTLRLYSWTPACLSLGHAQPAGDVDLAALKANRWDLVRRPTGGRAILHTDELTYSVTAHQDDPVMTGGILESYRRLSLALVSALETLGVGARADSRYDLPDGAVTNAPVCFEVPSNYEITANGKKLIGSAQARRNQGVLQHGSLPLYGDLTRIIRVLRFEDDQARQAAADRLISHATTVESLLRRPISWDECAHSVIKGFSDQLHLEFFSAEPSSSEISRAEILKVEKYTHPDWTYRL